MQTAKNLAPGSAYRRRRKIVSLVTLGLFVLALLTIALCFKPILAAVTDGEQFKAWVSQQGIWGVLAFLGVQILQVVVAFIPGEAVEIAAGYAFGPIWGAAFCLLGSAAGSVIIYGLTRRFGARLTEAFISREKLCSLKFIADSRRQNLLVFVLFFIPGTPKDVITYFIGLTPMRLRAFLAISTIARIPSVISSTIGGHALGSQNFVFAAVVFAVTGAVSLAGILLYQKIVKTRGGAKKK